MKRNIFFRWSTENGIVLCRYSTCLSLHTELCWGAQHHSVWTHSWTEVGWCRSATKLRDQDVCGDIHGDIDRGPACCALFMILQTETHREWGCRACSVRGRGGIQQALPTVVTPAGLDKTLQALWRNPRILYRGNKGHCVPTACGWWWQWQLWWRDDIRKLDPRSLFAHLTYGCIPDTNPPTSAQLICILDFMHGNLI